MFLEAAVLLGLIGLGRRGSSGTSAHAAAASAHPSGAAPANLHHPRPDSAAGQAHAAQHGSPAGGAAAAPGARAGTTAARGTHGSAIGEQLGRPRKARFTIPAENVDIDPEEQAE